MSEQPPAAGAARRRGVRRALAVAWLVAVAALPAGASVADAPGSTTLRVLQMNLCNSGRAGCYTGRSVAEAVAVIRADAPDLVTLNEICQDDVAVLERAFAEVRPGGSVGSAFTVAGDRPSGDATRCRNGRPYGIGLLIRFPQPYRGHSVHSGMHPAQDLADPEQRAWLCVHVPDVVHACTTHLAATSGAVALAQCGHLLHTVVPTIRSGAGYAPTVVGGDLNLRHGGSPDVRSCLPPGYRRVDDGAVQQILTDVTVGARRSVGLRGATDHPGLLATLTVDPARSPSGIAGHGPGGARPRP
ncbi:endonuclease/exonuclease/phosphatase family protein [Micromonospora coxensis]|uniref:Endonuclease/Exonuclease/phosphatase family protein n=1 Tax=Micromonospora coxensis TaxID=356852 RepID=A0A1C5H2D1_9ACTN|nr:endonuclease/exonuclease/phosphatase family protein [Micromonospora coxensis]SCG40212.1 Endonuclease/Exonuclease/phosphatase family protein [Micromonospora coxensis]